MKKLRNQLRKRRLAKRGMPLKPKSYTATHIYPGVHVVLHTDNCSHVSSLETDEHDPNMVHIVSTAQNATNCITFNLRWEDVEDE